MKVSAGTVRFGAVALQAVVDPVPAAMFVAVQFPLVAVAAFVPAGVPADVAPVVVVPFVPAGVKLTVPFVPAGVPALTADVVPADPLKVGWLTVPVGVMVAFPPVVPTSPFAASVPCRNWPLSALTSVKPEGQAANDNAMRPEGIPPLLGVSQVPSLFRYPEQVPALKSATIREEVKADSQTPPTQRDQPTGGEVVK